MNDGKKMVFVGGPMNGFLDQRYPELFPTMQFKYFPDRKKIDEGKMVVYQFVHFQDDIYYYEFAKTADIEEETDDEESL